MTNTSYNEIAHVSKVSPIQI